MTLGFDTDTKGRRNEYVAACERTTLSLILGPTSLTWLLQRRGCCDLDLLSLGHVLHLGRPSPVLPFGLRGDAVPALVRGRSHAYRLRPEPGVLQWLKQHEHEVHMPMQMIAIKYKTGDTAKMPPHGGRYEYQDTYEGLEYWCQFEYKCTNAARHQQGLARLEAWKERAK